MKRPSRIYWFTLPWLVLSMACNLVSRVPQTETPPTTLETAGPSMPARELFGKIAYGSDRGANHWGIIAMDANGGNEVMLTAAEGNYTRPAWSPDGKKIAMRADMDPSGIALMDVGYQAGKLAGSQPTLVSTGFADAAKWSPDGTRLIYSAAAEGSGWLTYIADVASGAIRQVSGIPENAVDPAWSPDGTRIVYAHYSNSADQIRDLYLINIDGSGLIQLTNTPDIDEQLPAWSPDGGRIAFSASKHSKEPGAAGSDIYVMNVDGSNLKQITSDPRADFDPAWSPDGKFIAFATDRHENNDSNYEIYVVGSDGTGERRLTNNHFTDRWPSWRLEQADEAAEAPCQPSIMLVSDVTIPAGTRFSSPENFVKVWRVQNNGGCAWTPDSYLLSYMDGDFMGGQLNPMPGAIQPGASVDFSVPLTAPEAPGKYRANWQLLDRNGKPVPGADGSPVRLTLDIEVVEQGQPVMPHSLYFLSETGNGQLWRMDTDGRTRTQITNETQPVLSFDIASDGRIAYFSNHEVITLDAQGTNRVVVASMQENEGRPELAWSPDGTQLAYSRGGVILHEFQTGSDHMLIADTDTKMPGTVIYAPREWAPDGSKLLVNAYLWESAALKVISVSDGSVLAELPYETTTWSNDSQAIYYASDYPGDWIATDPGLWKAPANGGAEETILSGPYIWWPKQAPDSSVYFFMHQPSSQNDADFTLQLQRLDPAAGSYQPVSTAPIMISANNFFGVSWSPDAQSYAAQIVRRNLGVSEVLLYTLGANAPLFLTQEEIGQFEWGR